MAEQLPRVPKEHIAPEAHNLPRLSIQRMMCDRPHVAFGSRYGTKALAKAVES